MESVDARTSGAGQDAAPVQGSVDASFERIATDAPHRSDVVHVESADAPPTVSPDAAPHAPPDAAPDAPATTQGLQFFGYYLVDVGFDDPTDAVTKNNYTDEVAAFSNIAQMAVYNAGEDIRGRVRAMNKSCVRPFLSLQEIFFQRVDKVAPSGTHMALYADYVVRWNKFKTVNKDVLDPDAVASLYVMDEPVWNGVTYDELDSLVRLLKADLPTVPLMVVEAYSVLDKFRVPPAVDYVGFDRYSIFAPRTDARYLANLAALASKLSSPSQRMFLVIDDQWLAQYGTMGVTPEKMARTIQDYYDIAKETPRVVGLLGYLWPGGWDEKTQLGVRNMPAAIQDLNRQIGTQIKARGPACPR